MSHFSINLINQAQEGCKVLELQGQIKDVVVEACQRIEVVEVASKHLKKVLAKVMTDLAMVRANLAEEKVGLAKAKSYLASDQGKREVDAAKAKEELAKVKKEVEAIMEKYKASSDFIVEMALTMVIFQALKEFSHNHLAFVKRSSRKAMI